MAKEGICRTLPLLTALARSYGQRGAVSKVFALNEEAINVHGEPIKWLSQAVIDGYLRREEYTNAVDYALQFPQVNVSNSQLPHSHARLLQEFAREGMPDLAMRVLGDNAAKFGRPPDDQYNYIVAALIVQGDLEQAEHVLRQRKELTSGKNARRSKIAVTEEGAFMRACFTADADAIAAASRAYDTVDISNGASRKLMSRPMINTVEAVANAFRVRGHTGGLGDMLASLDSVGASSYVHHLRVLIPSCSTFAVAGDAPAAADLFNRAVLHGGKQIDHETAACIVLRAVTAACDLGGGVSETELAKVYDSTIDAVDAAAAQATAAVAAHGWETTERYFFRSQMFDDCKAAALAAVPILMKTDDSVTTENDRLARAVTLYAPTEETPSDRLAEYRFKAMTRDVRAGRPFPEGLNLEALLEPVTTDMPPELGAAWLELLLANGMDHAAEDALVSLRSKGDRVTSVTFAPFMRQHAEKGRLDSKEISRGVALLKSIVESGARVTHSLVIPLLEACAETGSIADAVGILSIVKDAGVPISEQIVGFMYRTCCRVGDHDKALMILRLAVPPQCDLIGKDGFDLLLTAGHRLMSDPTKLEESVNILYQTGRIERRSFDPSRTVAGVAEATTIVKPAESETPEAVVTPRHAVVSRAPRKARSPSTFNKDFGAEIARLSQAVVSHHGSVDPQVADMLTEAAASKTVSLLTLCNALAGTVGKPFPVAVGQAVLAVQMAGNRQDGELVPEDLEVFRRGYISLDPKFVVHVLSGLRENKSKMHDSDRRTADELVALWVETHGSDHLLQHRDVSIETFVYYTDGMQDIRRSRELFDRLMACEDLSDEHAHQLIVAHLHLSIHKRNDQSVAELLDVAYRRGALDSDTLVVGTIKRLQQQARKSFDQFVTMLVPQIQHPFGEGMEYAHKVALIQMYALLTKLTPPHSSSNDMLEAAENTFAQIKRDGQTAGLWPRVFRIQALVSTGNRIHIEHAEKLNAEMGQQFSTVWPEIRGACSAAFVRGYSLLLTSCPVGERSAVVQTLLQHYETLIRSGALIKSGVTPDRKTTSALMGGLASVPETTAACTIVYENIASQGDAGAALKEFIKAVLGLGYLERHTSALDYSRILSMMQLRADVDCDNVLFMLNHLVSFGNREDFASFFKLRTRMAKNNRNLHMHIAEAHVLHLKSICGSDLWSGKLGKERAEALLLALKLMRAECGSIPQRMRSFVQEVEDAAQAEYAMVI